MDYPWVNCYQNFLGQERIDIQGRQTQVIPSLGFGFSSKLGMDLLFKFVSVPICDVVHDAWDSGNPPLVLHVTAIIIVIIFSQMPHIFNMLYNMYIF